MNKSLLVHQIPGLNVLVDGFRHAHSGCKDYFLTHFHGDHYTGLSSDFNYGKIYCTPITGALVKAMLGVREEFIQTVPIGGSAEVPGEDAAAAAAAVASVAFLDAHHCPGAALLLFRVRETGKAYLHTGDMRFDPKMKEYELLKTTKIDTVFLDTTYCHPKHTFSCQVDAISEIVSQIQKRLQEDQGSNNRTLFLLSAYNIGKEKILIEVARQTGYKIPVDEKKLRILDCLGLAPEDRALFEAAAAGPGGGGGGGGGGGAGGPGGASAATPLRVCRMGFCGETFPYFRPNFTNLQRYLERTNGEFTHIYSFVPTGWAASSNYNKRNSFLEKGNLAVSLVPYSEHSNFEELVEFIRFIKPRQVIPTVFSDAKDSARMVKRFQSYIDHTANKLTFFHKMKIKRGLNTHGDQQTKKSCGNSLGDQVSSLEPVVSSENVIMPSSQSSSSSMMNNTGSTWEEGNKKEQLPWKSDNEFGSQQVQRLAAATQLAAMNPCRDGPSNAVLIVEEDDLPVTNGQASSGGGNNQYQAAAEKMGARWACGVCTFVHAQLPEVGFLACAMCGHPRPTTATFAAAAQRHCPSGRTESSEAVSLSGTDGGAGGGKAGRKTKLQSPLGLVAGASHRKAKKQKSIKDLFSHFHKN